MTRVKDAIKDTAQHLRYELRGARLVVAALLGLAFLLIIGLAPNYRIFAHVLANGNASLTMGVFFGLVIGIFSGSEWYMAVLLVLIAALSAINLVLIVTRVKRLRNAGATGIGSLLGLFLAGCPSCATGLLPLLGVSAAAGFLPLHGVEFSIISVLLLTAALYWNATAERCRI